MNVCRRTSYHTLAFADTFLGAKSVRVCESGCPNSLLWNGNNVHVRPRVDLIIWIFMILQFPKTCICVYI